MRLENLWDEFKALMPSSCCNYEKSKFFVSHINKHKLYQFLMGLNESYNQARSQILMRGSLPKVKQAKTLVVGDERQKVVLSNGSNLSMNLFGLK